MRVRSLSLSVGGIALAGRYLELAGLTRLLGDRRLAWWQGPGALFERHDLLLTPTVACPPFPLGLDHPSEVAGKPVSLYGWIPFTYPFNLTGHPALAMMGGLSRAGLPLPVQLVGRSHDEVTLLRVAAAFERTTGWHQKHAPI